MKKRKPSAILLDSLLLIIFLCSIGFSQSQSKMGIGIYNVTDYGAVGDGTALNTEAIQSAINACSADSGGTVVIPAGDFLCGTLELKSNITFKISTKGRLLGSGKREDYTSGKGVPPGNGNMCFLYAANAHNITIEGNGTIDGQGQIFFNGRGDGTGPGGHSGNMDRPHLIIFYNCNNIFVHDILLTRSAYHCMRILNCKYVKLEGIRIYNRVNKNNDGFHFGSSEYVNISDCNIKCQDDACALFGSNKYVTVTNCTFSTRWSVFRFGGGNCENITVSNCVIYDTYGCPIKMSFSGRSSIQNISFSNIIMDHVTGPISIGLDSNRRRSNDTSKVIKGIVRNISFNSIRAYVVDEPRQLPDLPFPPHAFDGEQMQCIKVNGVGNDTIENISFTDLHVIYEGGGTLKEGAVREVPQIAGEYFQMGTPPSYGFFARNVKGLSFENVSFEYDKPDLRPAVIFDHVSDAAINNMNVEGNKDAESALRFIDSRDVLLTGVSLSSPAKIFLQTEGSDNSNIKISSSNLSKAEKVLSFDRGANSNMVEVK
jgi:polygalacturonase